MFTLEQQIEDLLGHVERVRANGRALARELLAEGRSNFARLLLLRVHVHDASKFAGVEWEWMHRGPDTAGPELEAAIRQHQNTNDHHPEYWGGMANMPEICVAEMCCDWLARSQEFATDLKAYITTTAVERYGLDKAPMQRRWIQNFVGMLLPEKFAKRKRK